MQACLFIKKTSMTIITIEIKVPNKNNPEVVFIVVNFVIGDLVCINRYH